MHQRQLRLGDILDDYCPRERRITNHAIVAMVGQDVKQTRCTTCDTEHEYKQARVPPQRRKKESPTALFDDVLAGMPRRVTPARPETVERPAALQPEPDPELEAEPESQGEEQPVAQPIAAAPAAAAPAPVSGSLAAAGHDEVEGPVHRQLIRATLPRPEGQATGRPIPEFTARTAPPPRPAGRFRPQRPGGPHGGGAANGFGFRGRRNGNGVAAGGPAAHGNRLRPAKAGQGQHRRRGGKKRSK